jgi:SAM-dependent methyltransferase
MRVNVGCGATPTAGWVNFDNSLAIRVAQRPALLRALSRVGLLSGASADLAQLARSADIKFANAAARLPCGDQSVDVLYSAHMVEHLDRAEVQRFLAEARRILRPGGILRIAVPDISLQIQEYLRTGDADSFIARTHLCLPRPRGLAPRVRSAVVGPRHHQWMYDGESLTSLLCGAGFTDVAVMPPGHTRITDPGRLDLRERENESVYAEAVQPG